VVLRNTLQIDGGRKNVSDFGKNRFSSKKQDWETPDYLFKKIDAVFHFTRDVCASKKNTKCKKFWSEQDSCLDKQWGGINWMNPPYASMKKFIKKAYEQRKNAITVCLVPARTNTRWWHEFCMKGEVYFICGRPKFKGCVHGLPQPLALVVFGKKRGIMHSFYYGESMPKKENVI
jgi:phage N-6-adenine-methyltransferase